MCLFSRPVSDVGSTHILVSALGRREHATVYRMHYQAGETVAMVLPIPVRRGSGEDAVTFVDMSGYRTFFDDLARCFPIPRAASKGGYGSFGGGARPMLVVQEIGDYVASFVPTIGDFDRLDPRFRLPDVAWGALPDYDGFGFAVVQLQPGERPKSVQPIAYRYPPERPGELFFPTAHLHDGHVEARARFEHVLYAQPFGHHLNLDRYGWEFGAVLPRDVVDMKKANGLVVGDRRVGRMQILGERPNADLVLRPQKPETSAGVAVPETEARLVRVPWDLGPTLTWERFEGLGGNGNGYGYGNRPQY